MKNINNTNKYSAVCDEKILAILAILSLFVSPITASAGFATFQGYTPPTPIYDAPPAKADNPTPSVTSINPNSGNLSSGARNITITGAGFIPSSVVKVNGVNRNATFIDASHMIVSINQNDMNITNPVLINVYNGALDGGYSNVAPFTIDNSSVNNTNTVNASSLKDSNGNALAASVLIGSNTFTPSGLIQWIFFAILILAVVILVRKVFGLEKKYEEEPMKHA